MPRKLPSHCPFGHPKRRLSARGLCRKCGDQVRRMSAGGAAGTGAAKRRATAAVAGRLGGAAGTGAAGGAAGAGACKARRGWRNGRVVPVVGDWRTWAPSDVTFCMFQVSAFCSRGWVPLQHLGGSPEGHACGDTRHDLIVCPHGKQE